jgi:reverse transcriptase-like protein
MRRIIDLVGSAWDAITKVPETVTSDKAVPDSRSATYTASASKVEWSKALNFEQSLSNCKTDMTGDWHRDPWGWVELDWIVENKREDVILPRILNPRVLRASRLDVAKENFGTRPAIVMDPVDRLIYQALVDSLSARLVGKLRKWVYGWRLPPGSDRAGEYSHQDLQWNNFMSHLERLSLLHGALLKTDIVSCFANINLENLAEELVRKGGSSLLVERLVLMLFDWQRLPDRTGLPQRSLASCVLANMYLNPIDDCLSRHNTIKGLAAQLTPEGSGARWMDDVWLFGQDEGALRKAQLELAESMRDIGLEMNFAKTDVYTGENLEKEVGSLQHSAVDGALKQTPMDTTQLTALIEELLEAPEHAPRTSLRFAGTRMRRHLFFDPIPGLVESADRMPHGADHLARVFRDSGAWRDLQDWYVSYAHGNWGSIDWSIAQFGTMFPTSKKPGSKVIDMMEEVLASDSSLSLTSLASQRLAAWDADRVRSALREAGKDTEKPSHRRVLSLAALAAGEQRHLVRKTLAEFEENLPLLEMLEDENFASPPIVPDYEAG